LSSTAAANSAITAVRLAVLHCSTNRPRLGVGAAGTIEVTSNRLTAVIGALKKCSAKRLVVNIVPRGSQFPILAWLGSEYIRPRDRPIATSAMADA